MIKPRSLCDYISLVNLLGTKGNFITGTVGVGTGWGKNLTPSCSFTGNVQSFLPSAQSHGLATTIVPITGHKYYACGLVKTTHANAIRLTTQGGSLTVKGSSFHSGSGTWEFLSVPFNLSSGTSAGSLYVLENLTTGFQNVDMKLFHVFDITAIFSVEPTQLQMDNIIKKFNYVISEGVYKYTY